MTHKIPVSHNIYGSICLIAAALALASCNATSTMKIPAIKSGNLLEVDQPLNDQATFALSKVIANIKRGTSVAHFPASGVDGAEGTLCNRRHEGKSTIEWGSGTSVLGNWSTELGEIFHEVLSQKGLRIAGDPKDLFGRKKSVASAEYLIGARIAEIKGNICQVHHWWDGRPLERYSGEMYVKVEWTVFSSLLQKESLKLDTEGYFLQKQPKRNGIQIAFHQAFAQATENLTSSHDLIKIAKRERSDPITIATGPKIHFNGASVSRTPIQDDLEEILSSVVTIRLGLGHGSGFIVSDNGLILSNAHVVGDAKHVSVVLNNGLEVEGQVLRTNEKRDVALIKTALRIRKYLPIRKTEVRPLEKVIVIGTPVKEGLKSTITAGVISAIRKDDQSGLSFIQSDAAISPGNSGGPLLDDNGNVIGISVASFNHSANEGLNLFIPIESALQALNLQSRSIAAKSN